jgi:hypothetical protein
VLDFGKTVQQGAIADGNQPRREALGREPQAKLRADPGRLARRERDDGAGGYRSSSRSST